MRPSSSPTGPGADRPHRATGRVELRDVWFRYPAGADVTVRSLEAPSAFLATDPDHDVLQGVSLVIEPGETVALVGASGSGKTTLSGLVPRLYDVTGGAVLVDGHDVRDLTQHSLREAIGVVSQDPHLFHETIGANLRYAKPDATDAAARRGVPRRSHPRHHRVAARRLRHRRRRARLPVERRREAAAGHRPPAAEEPGGDDPRRGHQPPRQRERGARAGGAGGSAPRSHGAGDRPPAVAPSATPTASSCSTTAASSSRARTTQLLALDGLYAAQVHAGETHLAV